MNTSRVVLAGLLLASATALAAQTETAADPAAEQEQRIQALFQQLDTNQDGALDASEAQAERGLKNAFARIATEGKVSPQRFAQWYRAYDAAPAQE